MRLILTVLLSAGVLSQGSVLAQTRARRSEAPKTWEDALEKEMGLRAAKVDKTLVARPPTRTGALGEDDHYTMDLVVKSGREVVLAVCDADCGDIDLYLYDSKHEQKRADDNEDKEPTLETRGLAAGAYTVEVYMVACKVSPCYFAVGVYEPKAP